jgi:hypothetical protein
VCRCTCSTICLCLFCSTQTHTPVAGASAASDTEKGWALQRCEYRRAPLTVLCALFVYARLARAEHASPLVSLLEFSGLRVQAASRSAARCACSRPALVWFLLLRVLVWSCQRTCVAPPLACTLLASVPLRVCSPACHCRTVRPHCVHACALACVLVAISLAACASNANSLFQRAICNRMCLCDLGGVGRGGMSHAVRMASDNALCWCAHGVRLSTP